MLISSHCRRPFHTKYTGNPNKTIAIPGQVVINRYTTSTTTMLAAPTTYNAGNRKSVRSSVVELAESAVGCPR